MNSTNTESNWSSSIQRPHIGRLVALGLLQCHVQQFSSESVFTVRKTMLTFRKNSCSQSKPTNCEITVVLSCRESSGNLDENASNLPAFQYRMKKFRWLTGGTGDIMTQINAHPKLYINIQGFELKNGLVETFKKIKKTWLMKMYRRLMAPIYKRTTVKVMIAL
jgi:hypothetical protein